MTNAVAPVRAAVVSPYWTFWEAGAGGSALRDDRRALLADAVAALRRTATGTLDVVCEGCWIRRRRRRRWQRASTATST